MKFEEINRIDVSEHVDKIKTANKILTYLSWTWAWAQMKKIDENAKVEVHEFPHYIEMGGQVIQIMKPYFKDDGGDFVKVSVTMNGRTETEWLPIMNYNNKSVVNADSMAINKSIKRCFVKALAMHGLGLYIYAGEDLPEKEDGEVKPKAKKAEQVEETKVGDIEIKTIKSLMAKIPGASEESLCKWLGIKKLEDMTGVHYAKAVRFLQGKLSDIQELDEVFPK